MPLLRLKDVSVTGRIASIGGTCLAGEIIHLVGPNGAGKSTLLACLAGLHPCSGEILFNNRPLCDWPAAALARHRAWLTQQETPPYAMPVWHYLLMHQAADKAQERMLSLAASLGLQQKLTRSVNQLSGGEWQRVRLAAVFMQIDPQVNAQGQLLLLDEPMTGLDVAQQAAVDTLLAHLKAAGIAIVMSSHDLNHSLRYADRVWLLREGAMLAQGKTEEVLLPAYLNGAYNMPFRLLSTDGYRMLIPITQAGTV